MRLPIKAVSSWLVGFSVTPEILPENHFFSCVMLSIFSAVEGRDCQALREDGGGLDPGDPGDAVAACFASWVGSLGPTFHMQTCIIHGRLCSG